MRKFPVYKDKRMIQGSLVTFEIVNDFDWEDLVIHRTKRDIHQRRVPNAPGDILIPTYRTIKDWLIKGEE